jgi:hypothetical protein
VGCGSSTLDIGAGRKKVKTEEKNHLIPYRLQAL